MDPQIVQQLAIGALLIGVGITGWLLPYRWNLLRLRRGLDTLLSESARQMVPKVVGAVVMLLGAAIVVGTAIVGSFK